MTMPIAIDTETTDLCKPDPCDLIHQPHMTEICAIKFNKKFKVIDKFSSLINVPVPVPEHIVRVTGITDEMLEDAPTFYEIYPDLCEFFMGEDTLVGHNIGFDVNILDYELRRLNLQRNFPWPHNHLCTIELSFSINNKRMKLGDLYELATGEKLEQAHRAENDVLATIACLKYLKKTGAVSWR
jgi:DNA polymerase III epsilon subunit family exonuclease